ncbi:MAG: hypothetical protein ACTSSM_05000 [Promethearchaeota archaeon]
MGTCNFCGKESELISSVLKICRKCILEKDWKKVHEHLNFLLKLQMLILNINVIYALIIVHYQKKM